MKRFLFCYFTFRKPAALTVIRLLSVVEVSGIIFIIYCILFLPLAETGRFYFFFKNDAALGDLMNENNIKRVAAVIQL